MKKIRSFLPKGLKSIVLRIYRIGCKMIYLCANTFGCVFVPVLTFHWFVSDEEKKEQAVYSDSKWYASLAVFKEQIIWLKKHHYRFIDTEELLAWKEGKIKLPKRAVLLTFDDGEISQLTKVLPLLNELDAKGTVFAVGKYWKSEKAEIPKDAFEDPITHFSKRDFLETNDRDLIEIQSHTYNLHYKIGKKYAADFIDRDEFVNDLEAIDNEGFTAIAMPFGVFPKGMRDILKKYYKCAFAFPRYAFPYVSKKSDAYHLPRIRVDGNMGANGLTEYL